MKKIKIIHHMQDGTILDSIEGYQVPVNSDTELVYRMLAEAILRQSSECADSVEENLIPQEETTDD